MNVMEYIESDANIVKQENAVGDLKILCCECGSLIEPNPANMCVACLRSHVDITEDIPKQAVIYYCRNCERYLQPPTEWVQCTLESRELLALCLKKLKGLKEVKLVDAGFIWTEPHSKRIKVKLTVHKEVFGSTMLQQVFIVEFTVTNQMCDDCHRTEAKDFWKCLVQVRQRSENKKTIYYLEQLILKHRAHENTLGIKPEAGGLDFYYANENHARKMLDFLQTMLPVKWTESKRLISHDIHSNTYNCKYTYSVDIAPISKDSLVCLSKKLAQQLGSISQICLVSRVANTIHLIDPRTAQRKKSFKTTLEKQTARVFRHSIRILTEFRKNLTHLDQSVAELNATVYYRQPFDAICNPKQLAEYIVMDIEVIPYKDRHFFPGQGKVSQKHVVCDIWLVRASELGINDNTTHTRTHLGHLLKPGDSVLCYNVEDANINDENFEKLNKDRVPDVVLVKKFYGDLSGRRNTRVWKLKHLSEDVTAYDRGNKDYNEFLEDLEDDPQLRQNVNIFKDSTKAIPVDTNDDMDPSIPRITLEEMLDDLVLDDDEMGEEV